MKKLLLLLMLTAGLSACLDPQEFSAEELQALVDAELEKKIRNYREVKMERCQEGLEVRANFIVDSLLFVQTQQQVDSLFINNKKQKPKRPDLRQIPDKRPIAPLFDTIVSDSLPKLGKDSLDTQ
ncbi:MAG TPA: hypothetical protein VJ953_01680 [Saprospiraceae bacterium]|nr:hypothetical protein [Saprospiraceae bacterium]